MFAKVINQHGVGIIRPFDITAVIQFGTAIPAVEPETGLRAGFYLGDLDPHEGFAHECVKFFDMIRQERLVVFGDKPQITAVFPCHSKLEITRMEPHQHRRRPDRRWVQSVL